MDIDLGQIDIKKKQQEQRDPFVSPLGGQMQSDNMFKKVGRGLADFMRSLGHGATNTPIDMAQPGTGWQSNLGGMIGGNLLEGALYGQSTGRIQPQFYNTASEQAGQQMALQKSIQLEQAKTQIEQGRLQKFMQENPEAIVKSSKIGDTTLELANPREERLRKNMEFANATKIRQEFINRPEVKEFVTINTQVKSMDSLLSKAKSGNIKNKVALDQALITMFNKLTDPNSVVRESEYARTPSNLPFMNRFSGAIQKLERGGAGITDSDRDALVWGAKVIANERGKVFNSTLSEYSDLASQSGIDPTLVTRKIPMHEDYNLELQKTSEDNTKKQKVDPKLKSIKDKWGLK